MYFRVSKKTRKYISVQGATCNLHVAPCTENEPGVFEYLRSVNSKFGVVY